MQLLNDYSGNKAYVMNKKSMMSGIVASECLQDGLLGTGTCGKHANPFIAQNKVENHLLRNYPND